MTWWTWAFAGVISAGSNAVLVGTSAAAVRQWIRPQFPITIAVSRNARPRWPSNYLTSHRVPVPDEDIVRAHGLAITSRTRTAVDLAQSLPIAGAQELLDRLLVLDRLTLADLAKGITNSRRHGAAQAGVILASAMDRAAAKSERLLMHSCARLASRDSQRTTRC